MTDESINAMSDEPVDPTPVPEPPAAPAPADVPPAPEVAPPAPPAPPAAPAYAPPPAPPAPGYSPPQGYAPAPAANDKQKVVAGILGILLGSLGIHKFYLGYNKEGIIMLVVTVVAGLITFGLASGAMSVIGLVEGIIYLTKSDDEFYATYVAGNKPWF